MSLSPLLHQPVHLADLAPEEAVDADFAAVGVEGDGGREQHVGFGNAGCGEFAVH